MTQDALAQARKALDDLLEKDRRRYDDTPAAQAFFRQNNETALAALAAIDAALEGGGWLPIESAPHDTNVIMAWRDETYSDGWRIETGMASWGWRRDGISNMSCHGQATHWRPLPLPPVGA